MKIEGVTNPKGMVIGSGMVNVENRDKENFWLAMKYPSGFHKNCSTCKYQAPKKQKLNVLSSCMIPVVKGKEFACVLYGYKYWNPDETKIERLNEKLR